MPSWLAAAGFLKLRRPLKNMLPTLRPVSVHQGFLAFNATAHSLISTALSRRKEAQAARVIARIAQLAVGISLVLGLGLYTGAWYCMVPRVPKRMGWPEEGAAGACAEQGRGLLVSPG